MLAVGVGIALAGFGILVAWKEACGQSWCTVAAEITYVVSGVVLPLFGVVTAIPVVQGCVNPTVFGVVSGLAGGNAAAAVGCAQSDD